MESAQRYLDAKERFPAGSEHWAFATAEAFEFLVQKECNEVAKPEWWNDEALKALSARVVRAAPNNGAANVMRAMALSLQGSAAAWEAGPRSAAELEEAATHWDRSAALSNAPTLKARKAGFADWCRSHVGTSVYSMGAFFTLLWACAAGALLLLMCMHRSSARRYLTMQPAAT